MSVHLTEANEDYIEAIVMINGGTDAPVRSVDLARHMGVSKPSINKAVSLLKEAGLVEQEPYGDIYLTEAGLAYGLNVYRRHTTLISFLHDVLGVDAETAEDEACRIEHTISEDTFERWTAFTEFYKNHCKVSACVDELPNAVAEAEVAAAKEALAAAEEAVDAVVDEMLDEAEAAIEAAE